MSGSQKTNANQFSPDPSQLAVLSQSVQDTNQVGQAGRVNAAGSVEPLLGSNKPGKVGDKSAEGMRKQQAPANRPMGKIANRKAPGRTSANDRAVAQDKNVGFVGKFVKIWKAIPLGVKIAFVLLGASIIMGDIIIGMLSALYLMYAIGKACVAAQKAIENLKEAQGHIGELEEKVTDQGEQLRDMQGHVESLEEHLGAAETKAAAAQQSADDFEQRLKDFMAAFAKVGSQAKVVAEGMKTHLGETRAVVQSVIEGTEMSVNQTLENLGKANGAIKGKVDSIKGGLDQKFGEIKALAEKQNKALEEALKAYGDKENPTPEDVKSLFLAMQSAMGMSREIGQKFSELQAATAGAMDEIARIVDEHIRQETQRLAKEKEGMAEEIGRLTQLLARQKQMDEQVKNLEEAIGKVSPEEANGKLGEVLGELKANLESVSAEVKAAREKCGDLGTDLEAAINANAEIVKGVKSVGSCVSEAQSCLQGMAFSGGDVLKFVGAAAVGGGAAALAGAGAMTTALVAAAAVGGVGIWNTFKRWNLI